MTSTPQNLPATHDSGATPTVAPSTAPKPDSFSNDNTTNSPSQSSNAPKSPSGSASQSQAPPDEDVSYPEQKHAGKVGYGPNYRKTPVRCVLLSACHSSTYYCPKTLEEKIEGLKDELKGKVTRKPELVEHGRQILSGEEKRKKLTGEVIFVS